MFLVINYSMSHPERPFNQTFQISFEVNHDVLREAGKRLDELMKYDPTLQFHDVRSAAVAVGLNETEKLRQVLAERDEK